MMTLGADDDLRSCGTELAGTWLGGAALEQRSVVDSVGLRLVDEAAIRGRPGTSESDDRQAEPVLAPDQLARMWDLLMAELTALRNRALEQCADPHGIDEVLLLRMARLRSAVVGIPPAGPGSAGTSVPTEEP